MGFFKWISEVVGRLFGSTSTTSTETTTTRSGGPEKRAVCVGINNYKGVANDLKGCVNDAHNWTHELLSNRGFDSVKLILDQEAKMSNVTANMRKLISKSKAGDVLVFTFSGHGTTMPEPILDRDEADGKDEAICLYDGNLRDDDIRAILSDIPAGVKFTFISDSCHSGTVTRSMLATMSDNSYVSVPKYMPPEDQIEANQLASMPLKKGVFEPRGDMAEVLISGCKSDEYSYDANIGGQPTGAFSYYALEVLKENKSITYTDFYKKLREKLPSSRYPQTPQLEGSEANKNALMFE